MQALILSGTGRAEDVGNFLEAKYSPELAPVVQSVRRMAKKDMDPDRSQMVMAKSPVISPRRGQRPGLRMEVTMRGTFMPESRRVQVLDSEAEVEAEEQDEVEVS